MIIDTIETTTLAETSEPLVPKWYSDIDIYMGPMSTLLTYAGPLCSVLIWFRSYRKDKRKKIEKKRKEEEFKISEEKKNKRALANTAALTEILRLVRKLVNREKKKRKLEKKTPKIQLKKARNRKLLLKQFSRRLRYELRHMIERLTTIYNQRLSTALNASTMTAVGGMPMGGGGGASTMTAVGAMPGAPAGGASTMTAVGGMPMGGGGGASTMTAVGAMPAAPAGGGGASTMTAIGGAPRGQSTMTALGAASGAAAPVPAAPSGVLSNGITNERVKYTHLHPVNELINKADKLYQQINACDDVFEKLEQMLIGFQSELGSLSNDMTLLQEQSVSISLELENRKKVHEELAQFYDDIVVPQSMIKAILEADTGDRVFLEQLHELQHKLQFLRAQEFKKARAVNDVQGILNVLKVKALEKIHEWILQKVYQYRKPLANYQEIQNQLLKNRFFYEFLLANERYIAQEVQEEYLDTVSKMHCSYFRTYSSRLFKLMMTDCATKDDLLGAEDTIRSYGLTFFSSKPIIRKHATVFSLGNRQSLITDDLLSPIIIPHAAQEAGQKFQFESLFRSINYALTDHASHEYLFLTDFFLLSGQSAIDLHNKVLARSLTQLTREWDERIGSNFDAISLHVCISICDKMKSILKQRNVPPLTAYWDAISNQLWTRFEQLMSLHNESVRVLDVKKLQPPVDTRPHYIIRRYAELTCAFYVVTEACGKQVGKKMEAILESSEDAIEQLLLRFSAQLSSPREKLIVLINNYDLILTIIDERFAHDNRVYQIIHELMQKAIGEFVEVSLAPHFGPLVSFVNECEPLITQQATNLLVRYNDKLSSVIRSFSANWKRSIDSINGEIVKSFTNFKNGTNILQAAFTQLVHYYQRFTKIAQHDAFRDCASKQEMVNVHVIIVELKKYKPVY